MKLGSTIRKATRLALVLALAAAPAALAGKPKPVDLGNGVTSPEPGVVCDKKAGFCADSQGISMALTEMYLGKAAQDKMMARVKENPDADMANYTLYNGVQCRSAEKACFKPKGSNTIEKKTTQALFPPPAKTKPVDLGNGVTSPEPGVVCDKKAGFCADSQGISMALTEMYLGKAAQDKMMARVKENPDADMANYTLANGVQCRTAEKACFKPKGSKTVESKTTHALFP